MFDKIKEFLLGKLFSRTKLSALALVASGYVIEWLRDQGMEITPDFEQGVQQVLLGLVIWFLRSAIDKTIDK